MNCQFDSAYIYVYIFIFFSNVFSRMAINLTFPNIDVEVKSWAHLNLTLGEDLTTVIWILVICIIVFMVTLITFFGVMTIQMIRNPGLFTVIRSSQQREQRIEDD